MVEISSISTSSSPFSGMEKSGLYSLLDQYPWFVPARARLCISLLDDSGTEAAYGMFRDSLPYFPDGAYVAGKMRRTELRDFSDADLAAEIRSAISEKSRIIMAGGDYFTLSEYDSVRESNDADIRRMAIVDYSAPNPSVGVKREEVFDMVSETLAQIYLDQGYPDKANEIYIKLSLMNPEKSAYFAKIIEKLKTENKT